MYALEGETQDTVHTSSYKLMNSYPIILMGAFLGGRCMLWGARPRAVFTLPQTKPPTPHLARVLPEDGLCTSRAARPRARSQREEGQRRGSL